MVTLPCSVRIYLSSTPTDMRNYAQLPVMRIEWHLGSFIPVLG
jgi:hypothetical protein